MTITPQLMRTQDANGQEMQYYAVGITCRISHNPLKAITAGTQATWNMMKSMFTALEIWRPAEPMRMISRVRSVWCRWSAERVNTAGRITDFF